VVGVATTEEPKLDVATADGDRGPLRERPIRRVEDDLGKAVGQVRLSAAMAAFRRSPVRSMNGTQPAWPQIVAGRKMALPKAWSKWPWVSTTTVIGSAVTSRTCATTSRACP